MPFCNFRFFCLLFGLVVTFTQVLGQKANSLDDLQVLEGDQRQLLWNHLTSQCDRLDRQRAERLAKALKSPAALKQHLTKLRDDYHNILGSFPKKQPLNAKVTGKLDGTSYRVEKVLFESLPNHHVTALLYLPANGEGPWPGVLFACGHSANGKAYPPYQTACALLAQNGFVVLSYDPISQGERTQLPKAARYGTTTHTLLNHGARLTGRSVVWYSAWDGIRSIDYLLSRPEVDRSKPVGMTGTSGGGTQTTFLMALDDRIGPAAPSCYTMQRTDKFRGKSGPADGCQHLSGEGLHGIDHIDYSLMRFPRPTAILAATQDFFEIDSTRETVRDAKAVFGALGQADRFAFYEADTTHGMHVGHRQEATRWMRQWLYNDSSPVTEPKDIRLFTDAELQVTRTGQVHNDFPDEANVADISLRLASRLETKRRRFWAGNPAKALAKVRKLIGLPENLPQTRVKRGSQAQIDWARIDKFTLQRAGDMPVPALLFRPPGNTSQALDVVIYADGRGMRSVAHANGPIQKLVNESTAVFAVDLRGLGETRDQGSNAKYHSHSHRVGNVATHIGQPLLGQRVRDLLAVVDYLNEVGSERVRSIRVIGVGSAGPVALHAAALDAQISKVELRNPALNSWVSDVVAQPLHREMVDHVVPGALTWYDLPDLAHQLGTRLRIR